MERRGDGKSRRNLPAALENRQRKNSRDAPNLDQGGRRVPRRIRKLRSDLVFPKTGPGRRTADFARLAVSKDFRSRRRILRRLDADKFSAIRSRRQPEGAGRSW